MSNGSFDVLQIFWEPFTRDGRRPDVETYSNTAVLGPPGRLLGAIRPVQLATPQVHMTADFGAVYATQRDRLVRALSMSLGDDALATEAVDEAFTRALHRWHAVGSFDEPQAWIYRTARNWANSRFRRRSRDRRFAPKIARAESTTDQPADPQLADALAGLSPDQRNVLVLRYYLDWSIDATADALDASVGTVKSRTNRALTELNRILGDRR